MTLLDTFSVTEHRRAARPVPLGYGLGVSIVRNRQDFDALAERWQALEAVNDSSILFQSFGWARAIFDFEAARGNADFDPVIAVLAEGQRLLAVLPLERVSTKLRRVLVPLGNGFGQYADMLVVPEADPAHIVGHLLRAALSEAPSDVVSLLKVRQGSALERGLPQTKILTGTIVGAPYVALDQYSSFTSYFATVRTKTRKNMRNARNRLERTGSVENRIIEDRAEREALIERTLAGRAERLRDQGLTSRAFRDGGFVQFCKALAGRPDVEIMAFSLLHQGRPIAEQWGFVQGGRYYAYVATRDFSHSDESPGKLHLAEILRACAAKGLSGVDLGVPVMPYKLTFATETVPVHDYALPITAKGRAFAHLWDVWLRPNMKKLVLKMPVGLRTRLMRLAGWG